MQRSIPFFAFPSCLFLATCSGARHESSPAREAVGPSGARSAPLVTAPQRRAESLSRGALPSRNTLFSVPPKGSECPALPVPEGNTYFVCDCAPGASPSCNPGDDRAAGTREAPFRSYSKARDTFRQMQAGQTVALCRGGAFTVDEDRDWTNGRCESGQPCVLRDYDPPGAKAALGLPILRVADGDGITLVNGGLAEHEEGFVFMNLDLRSASRGRRGNGFFLYNDVDDVLMCGVSIDGFAIGVHSGGANESGPESDGKNARVVLRNARLSNNGDQGWLGGCDGCGIANSTFENNGFNRAILNHSIYFGGTGVEMFALYNDLYRSAIVGGKCQGAPIVAHGQLTRLRIEGNTVREEAGKADPTCWGIAVDTGYEDRVEAFHDVVIRGNDVINVGNVGIGLNACQGCVIEDNLIVHEQPFSSSLIAVPDRARSPNDLAMGAVSIRRNTLIVRAPSEVIGIRLGDEGEGHVVVDNALLSLGGGRLVC
ncbi:MAG TPA: right-handed parallel beta-helix repeat-containing protein, partial [Polyangiaceae bacterium]